MTENKFNTINLMCSVVQMKEKEVQTQERRVSQLPFELYPPLMLPPFQDNPNVCTFRLLYQCPHAIRVTGAKAAKRIVGENLVPQALGYPRGNLSTSGYWLVPWELGMVPQAPAFWISPWSFKFLWKLHLQSLIVPPIFTYTKKHQEIKSNENKRSKNKEKH